MNVWTTPDTLPTQRMKRLAIQWITAMPATQRDRQEAIRSLRDARGRGLGCLSLTAAREAVESVAKHCAEQRRQKRRAWQCHYRLPRGYVLPTGTPASRLRRRRVREIASAKRSCLRTYEREEDTHITLVESLSECGISLSKQEGWIEYSRRFGNRRGIVSARYTIAAIARIPIPREIGGLLTLGAERAESMERPNERVYRAVWARQAQDGPARERGFIVGAIDRHGEWTYAHGSTIGAARGVLSRRLGTTQRLDPDEWERLDRWREAVRRKLERGQLNGYDVAVRLADARSAGLCEPGIRAWCERNHIDPDGSETVSTLLAISDQREYVLAACLAAIQRQMATESQAAA